jgi:cytochrome c553
MRTPLDAIRVLALAIASLLVPTMAGAVTIAGPVPEPADWNAPASTQPCSGCHGVDGNSRLDFIPRLAGLQADYISKQMTAFRTAPIPPTIEIPAIFSRLAPEKDTADANDHGSVPGFFGRVLRIGFVDRKPPPGGRSDAAARVNMIGIAHATTEQDVAEVAAWYAKQKPAPGRAANDSDQVAAGKTLFAEGLPANGVPPCSACHGSTAEGMGPFPRLAGQPAPYLQSQLQAFADGMRTHAAPMGQVARHLDPAQIAALAAYLETL